MKTIKDFNLEGKKVIIRVDFNVPIENGIIQDDNRIIESLDTIKYALSHNAKVILMSHLGRIKTKEDLAQNSLYPVSRRLSELLDKEVLFINKTRGIEVNQAIDSMKNGDIILLENTRYEDLDDKKESNNDSELGQYWASLGDIFINDAFGTAHRMHASNVGIASHLPSGIGFLIEKELQNILPAINNPTRPFTVILGGSKVSDKIGIITNLIDKADYILIGGGMAYTFLKAKGIEVGKSLIEEDKINYCVDLLSKTDKIILPIDHVTSKSLESNDAIIKDQMQEDDIGLDIGEKTIKLFTNIIQNSKTILWNGPLGMFEKDVYANGTKKMCEAFDKDKMTIIVGGGDTASAVISMGYKEHVTHISTGGGASLMLLEGKELPGISVIQER